MLRSLILASVCLFLILIQKANGNSFHKSDDFLKSLKHYAEEKREEQMACKKSSDCLEGFFCKNNDCIAKRPEGSLCLSSKDEECMCGKCTLNPATWNKICLSESLDECPNGGISPLNDCKSNEDCPKGHFCDLVDGKVCVSKLPAGRLCFNDEMCVCGKCGEVSHISRPNKAPISFNVCNSC